MKHGGNDGFDGFDGGWNHELLIFCFHSNSFLFTLLTIRISINPEPSIGDPGTVPTPVHVPIGTQIQVCIFGVVDDDGDGGGAYGCGIFG